jgi:hypothetical protein
MSTTSDAALTVEQLDHGGRTSPEVYTAGFYGGDRSRTPNSGQMSPVPVISSVHTSN